MAARRRRLTPALARQLQLLVLDVDGVLTDGGLWFGPQGEVQKRFHVRDGHGIKLLQRAGLVIAVISGRRSKAVALRCRELGIRHVFQGAADKSQVFSRLLQRLKLAPGQAICIGDDTPDVPLFVRAGFSVAVCDGHPLALAAADRTTTIAGGHGAVREVCDWLLEGQEPTLNRRLLLPALVALLVLGLAFVLGQSGRTPRLASIAAPEEAAGLGYVARDVLVEQTDAAGQLQYSLQAGHVEQHSVGAPIVAQTLTLQYEPLDRTGRIIAGRRWTVSADSGELPEDAGLLELTGNVIVRAQLTGAAEPMTVRTEALSYDTSEQRLSSKSDVAFVWGRQQLQGRGLKADIRAGTLALESGVHGRLSP